MQKIDMLQLQWQQLMYKYQQKLKQNPYKRAVMQQKQHVYEQLTLLNRPSIVYQHQPQTKALINKLSWYDTDAYVQDIIIQAYNLIYHDQIKPYHKLKNVIHQHRKTQIKINNGTSDSVKDQYDILIHPDILEFLWNHNSVRSIIFHWIDDYLKIKLKYGMEALSDIQISAHQVKKFNQLMTGVNDQTQIKLRQYKGRSRQILTKQQWKNRVVTQLKYLSYCWD